MNTLKSAPMNRVRFSNKRSAVISSIIPRTNEKSGALPANDQKTMSFESFPNGVYKILELGG